jgi:hypothetical protein
MRVNFQIHIRKCLFKRWARPLLDFTIRHLPKVTSRKELFLRKFLDRAKLTDVYTDQSCMTFEGAQFQGKQPIMEKLTSLPFKKVNHQITTVDSQPIIGVDDNQVNLEYCIFAKSFQGMLRHGHWPVENRRRSTAQFPSDIRPASSKWRVRRRQRHL